MSIEDPGSLFRSSDFNLPQLPQYKKPGMFGNKGQAIGQALIGALAGYLASRGNRVGALTLESMAQQRQAQIQHQQELDDYDRRRTDENADWRSHYDYEAQNPKPTQPGEFEQRLIASGVQPGTPQWTDAMKAAVQNVTDPVVMTPQGPMLRSQVMGALQQQSPKPLTDDDILRMQGGQTAPSPSGGFPGY